jgi:hypothetical protein
MALLGFPMNGQRVTGERVFSDVPIGRDGDQRLAVPDTDVNVPVGTN